MQRIGLGKSVIGKVRSNNEDSILVCNETVGELPNLFVVADGMGGHNAGEVASAKSIDFFKEFVSNYRFPNDSPGKNGVKFQTEGLIEKGIVFANEKIYNMSTDNRNQNGMGTTFSACVISGNELCFGHVGDSRIYLISKTGIRQITIDHTYVNEMVISGELTLEQAKNHPKRNMLTRALGTEDTVLIDNDTLYVSDEETVLLCSDGLTSMISETDIFNIINSQPNKEATLSKLVDLANEKGGFDNISVIII